MAYALRTEKQDGSQHTYPPCSHFAIKNLDYAATLPGNLTNGRTGVEIEMTHHDGKITLIHLPTDGDKVYVMNADTLDTVDTIYYPPRPKTPRPLLSPS